jgi:hypothetical protein
VLCAFDGCEYEYDLQTGSSATPATAATKSPMAMTMDMKMTFQQIQQKTRIDDAGLLRRILGSLCSQKLPVSTY